MKQETWTAAEYNRFVRLGVEPDRTGKVESKGKRDTSEAVFQGRVIKIAEAAGWMCYHTYDSRRCRPGYPDVTLVRGGRLIFAELKRENGKLRPEQVEWIDALTEVARAANLHGADRIGVYVWRPSDLPEIEEVLK